MGELTHTFWHASFSPHSAQTLDALSDIAFTAHSGRNFLLPAGLARQIMTELLCHLAISICPFRCSWCSGDERLHPKSYKAEETDVNLLRELRQVQLEHAIPQKALEDARG